jgi:two-component system clock-associated histidine kinase SasA
MPVSPDPFPASKAPLQLLLFVDHRAVSWEQASSIQDRLRSLKTDYPFSFDIVDLAQQLELWWDRWQEAVQASIEQNPDMEVSFSQEAMQSSLATSSEVIRLSDEVFRLGREKVELQELLQFKDRAIEILAHDLRNPLAAASMAIETLEYSYRPNTIQSAQMTDSLRERLLIQARNQIRSIDRLIANLLEVAQSEGSEADIQPQPVDLKALCFGAIDAFSDRMTVKKQTLETDIPQDLPTVYADRDRIYQVIANLIDNAIKYTPDGGSINIATLHRTSQKVQVSICDSGPGIPDNQRDSIFKERFRLQRDQQSEGYGIGLAACQRTIRAHYGQIWVDERPGGGSCFHFTLPVYARSFP